jgi:hypothetical protein
LFAGSKNFTPTEIEVFYWIITTFCENMNSKIVTILWKINYREQRVSQYMRIFHSVWSILSSRYRY